MPLRTIWRPWKWTSLVLSGGLLIGCSTSEKKLSYVGETDLQHYKDVVTSIDYPAVNQETPDEVSFSDEPRRIRNPRKDEIWNLGLEEALHTALSNNEIIRDNGQFLSPGNRLLTNPDFVQSVYDPAVQDSSTLFGQNGVEAALSEFDAQFTTNMLFGRTKQISETNSFNHIQAGDTQAISSGDFRATLSKIFGNGGQASIQHNILWQSFNNGSGAGAGGTRLFQTYFTNNPSGTQNGGIPGLEFDYRQPLWAGGGTRFTRIAGPISRRPTLQNVPQVNQGVVISRIRTDIALADFEQATIGLVKDVEDLYWELYLAYRAYDTDMTARNSFLHTWREVKAKTDQGLEGGSAADEAQARDGYFDSRAASENSLSNVYNTEGRFRRLLGLPVNDGRIIRPENEPTTAEFLPDWRTSLVEALTRRVELRKQKWNIKSLEFQLEASKSLTNPRLDFVSRYQVNGFGDQLFGNAEHAPSVAGGNGRSNSFYDNLLSGNQTGGGLGFEFSMPIGFRAAHSQVRNIELKLTKARAALGVQELEVSHELANAFRQLDTTFQTAQTFFNRRRAAERRLQANEAQYKAGKGSVDLLLRAQISLAQAEKAYYQSVVGYNRAILDMKYRKGTLMDDDNVFLSESLSHPEAYSQALRHAWARSHAINANHLDTQPEEFVNSASDPAELGTSVYSTRPASGLNQPPAPQPAADIELPASETRPLPNPEFPVEPAAPAPPVKKELPNSAAHTHSPGLLQQVQHSPSLVQPAKAESLSAPETKVASPQIEQAVKSSAQPAEIREQRSADRELDDALLDPRPPATKSRDDEEDLDLNDDDFQMPKRP